MTAPWNAPAEGLGNTISQAIGGAIPIVGPLISGIASAFGQAQANRENRREAQRNRDFQERMSSSAYQRATTDMRLAGINPMLAYMQGGASSPSGSTATSQDMLGPAVASAQHARRLSQEIQNMSEQRELTRAQVDAARANRANTEADTALKHIGQDEARARIAFTNAQAASTRAGIPVKDLTGSIAGTVRPIADLAREGWTGIAQIIRNTRDRSAGEILRNLPGPAIARKLTRRIFQ